MQPRRHLVLVIAPLIAGAGVVALSFVPGWLTHDRVLLGEGPRRVPTLLSAWQGLAVPVVAAAVVLLAATAIPSVLLERPGGASAAGRTWTRRIAFFAAALALGLLAGSVPPVSQEGHASSVTIGPGAALGVGLGLALVSTACLAVLAGAGPRLGGAALLCVVIAGGAGWGGRQLQLLATEGTGENFRQGSYTRQAISDQPTETLTFRDGRIAVAGRWSGRYEASGRVVALTGDPACPDARGSYHVDAVPGGIRWERIVDLCAGGARARDLTTGVWSPDG